MNTLTNPNSGAARRSLAAEIDRLDGILDGLSDGLDSAVTQAVRAALERELAPAAREAVRTALAEKSAPQLDPTGGWLVRAAGRLEAGLARCAAAFTRLRGRAADQLTAAAKLGRAGLARAQGLWAVAVREWPSWWALRWHALAAAGAGLLAVLLALLGGPAVAAALAGLGGAAAALPLLRGLLPPERITPRTKTSSAGEEENSRRAEAADPQGSGEPAPPAAPDRSPPAWQPGGP